jgi:hypothetical protein
MTPNVYIEVFGDGEPPDIVDATIEQGDLHGIVIHSEDFAGIRVVPPTAEDLNQDGDHRPPPFWQELTIDVSDPDYLDVRFVDPDGETVVMCAVRETTGEIRYGGPEVVTAAKVLPTVGP